MRKDFTLIVMILDRSGSMASCHEDTVGGFNQFLTEQKKLPGDAVLTLAQFDNEYEVVCDFVNLKNMTELTYASFQPRGMTALLDAMGRTINSVGARLSSMREQDRPDKVIVVTITDGMENASREFDKEKIVNMIKHQKERYNWQFVFIGANQDAIATGVSFGTQNSMNYNTDKTKQLYGCVSNNVGGFRGSSNPQSFNWDPNA